jgi:hypothetical protein
MGIRDDLQDPFRSGGAHAVVNGSIEPPSSLAAQDQKGSLSRESFRSMSFGLVAAAISTALTVVIACVCGLHFAAIKDR